MRTNSCSFPENLLVSVPSLSWEINISYQKLARGNGRFALRKLEPGG